MACLLFRTTADATAPKAQSVNTHRRVCVFLKLLSVTPYCSPPPQPLAAASTLLDRPGVATLAAALSAVRRGYGPLLCPGSLAAAEREITWLTAAGAGEPDWQVGLGPGWGSWCTGQGPDVQPRCLMS